MARQHAEGTKRAAGALAFALCLLVVTLTGGCAFPGSGQLRLAAGKQDSATHELGTALADVFNGRVDGIGLSVVQSEDDNTLALLLDHKADLAIAFSDSIGDGDIRTLAPLYELYLYIIVWEDSGLNTITSLRGKRLGLGPKGSGTDGVARRLLQHYEFGERDAHYVNDSHLTISEAFVRHELDAVFILGSIESTAVERMLRAPGAQLLSLDDPSKIAPAMDGIRTKHPFVVSHVVPKHLFGNKPSEPTGVIGVDSLLVARADLSDELASTITRAVFANRVELGRKVSRLRELDERFDRHSLRFPLHPGASQYYRRDEPPAIVGWAPTISMFLTLSVLSWSALLALAARRRRKRKTLLDELYGELHRIAHGDERVDPDAASAESTADDANAPLSLRSDNQLHETRKELQALRRRAFGALMAGNIEANSAFLVFHDYLRSELDEIDRQERRNALRTD